MKTLLPLALTLLLPTLPCAGEAISGRTCRIVFPERTAKSLKSAYLFDGKDSSFVRLPSMNFSSIIPIRSGKVTVALTKEQLGDDTPLPDGAPRVEIGEKVEDFYLLLSSDPDNEVCPLKIELIDISQDELRPGETLWINRTDHLVEATLGKATIELEAKKEVVCPKPVAESGYYRAEFRFQPEGAEAMKAITEQHWWHDVKSRHLGFVVNSKGKLPRIFFFRDFRTP